MESSPSSTVPWLSPLLLQEEEQPLRRNVPWLSPLLLQDGEQPLRPDENLGEEGEEGDPHLSKARLKRVSSRPA
eukprot:scaffold12130_cov56-Phaeocystis_antarctica.AAC.6